MMRNIIKHKTTTAFIFFFLGIGIILNSCSSIDRNKKISVTSINAQNLVNTQLSKKIIQAQENSLTNSEPWFREPKGVSIETAIKYQGLHPQETVEIYRTEPFRGSNVVRISSQQALSALPDGYRISTGDNYSDSKYKIIDSWTGLLKNQKFLLNIYKSLQNQNILVGLSYNGKPILAKLISSNTINISNFTGEDVVFSYGKSDSHWMAINLVNGNVRSEGIALEFSGCYPCHGGRPNSILGLDKKYSVQPNSN